MSHAPPECICCKDHPTTSLPGCPTVFRFWAEEGEDFCAMCRRAWRAVMERTAAKAVGGTPVCFATPSTLPRDVEWPKHKDGSSALAPFAAYLCDGEIIVKPSLNLAPLFDGSAADRPLLPDGVHDAENGRLFTYWQQVVTCPACLRALARCQGAA